MNLLRKLGEMFDFPLAGQSEQSRHGRKVLLGAALVGALLVVATSPLKAVAIVASLAAAAAAFVQPELVVAFLALYTPFEPFLLKFVPDDVYLYARYSSEALIYVLLAAVFVKIALGRKKFSAAPIDLPFFFFLLTALTSLLINFVPPLIGILGLRQIVRFILIFFIIVYLNPETKFIKTLTKLMFGIVLFQGLLGLIQAYVGAPLDEFLIPSERKFFDSIQLTGGTLQFWSPGARVFATMGRYDQLGTFLSFFFSIGVGLLYSLRDKATKYKIAAIMAASLPAFILTLSRASWFGFAFAVIVIGIVLMRDRRLMAGVAAVILGTVVYLGFSGLVVRYLVDYPSQTLAERFFETFSYERYRGEYYGLGRVYWFVQTPLVVVRSSPLFGVGPGQYGGGAAAALGNTGVYEKLGLPFGVAGTGGYIDNNWFALWGETGTLGLIFYAWMILALGLMALQVWHRSKDPFTRGLALGYVGCLVAIVFQALLGTYFEVRTLALYLWLFGAFVCVLGRRDRSLG
ncbi:MAG: O-antigen ligase family protein [Patescibacteria group bacterium]|mgnify:CR=1 FL=1